jgi:serine protease
MLARVRVADAAAAVVEYYNSQLDHYFITADPAEQAAVDAGAAGPGWRRTGQGFRAYTPALGVPPGQSPVCRFYGSTAIDPATGLRRGPNSHFYTAQAAECAAVKNDPGWVLEGIAFFTRLPEASGLCAAGTLPVFRSYNNRAQFNDSNHRYTSDFATYASMQGLGWRPEGVVFCAVPG